jgi:16S rRNA (cytidine1402-2'-O)-methyltransferase
MPLWIIATPIGTLDDLSPRAREKLGTVDVICAEDTRTTRRLLTAVGITAPPLVALHAHNEGQRAEELAARALTGEVALVSDAGTPGVSDPGNLLVQACHAAGVEIRSVPGPSALSSALAASGLPAIPSTFLGFPPRKGRDAWCAEVLRRPETLVIYEAPTRVGDLVARLASVDPAREAVLCRELSKRFEEVRREPLQALAANLAARELVRGECVLVVAPAAAVAEERVIEDLGLDENSSLKDIAAVLAQRWGVNKREAYQALLDAERRLPVSRP